MIYLVNGLGFSRENLHRKPWCFYHQYMMVGFLVSIFPSSSSVTTGLDDEFCIKFNIQRLFQEPKLEVSTTYKAYVRAT